MQIAKNIFFCILTFALISCDAPRSERLIKNSFGRDLTSFIKSSDSEIKSDVIYVRKVNPTARELNFLVNLKDHPKRRNFYIDGKKISKDSWGESICLNWGDIDGITQYAIYYPSSDLLILGFFSGMDE
jgi:hypothetical protein